MTHLADRAPDRWVLTTSGWRHRPLTKVAINTVLRAVQRGPTKWLVRSICDDCEGGHRPRCTGYDFGPVEFTS